jgi:hypothetical protein
MKAVSSIADTTVLGDLPEALRLRGTLPSRLVAYPAEE